jgi:putative endonuclease
MFSFKLNSNLAIGRLGEQLAAKEMQKIGVTVLQYNFAVHGLGEIDIIGRDGGCLVFVEVKTRRRWDKARPGAAVNKQKRKKIWKTAHSYMRQLGAGGFRFRFDVVEVYLVSRFRYKVIYLPGAFDRNML